MREIIENIVIYGLFIAIALIGYTWINGQERIHDYGHCSQAMEYAKLC